MQHDAACAGHAALPCGTIPVDRFPGFLQMLAAREAAALSEAQPGRGEQRKVQRTPAYIHALAVRVLQEVNSVASGSAAVHARGGFSDVGRHTGSEARDTCWPLVREVIKVRAQPAALYLVGHSLYPCTDVHL